MSAASKNVLRIATANDTSSSWASVNHPPTAAIGIVTSSTARPRSAQTITGRRRSRSTQAPTIRPNSSAARRSIERTRATSNAPASSTRIATNGSAIRVISEPKIEIVAADHTRTNALFCQSGEANGLRTGRTAYPADRVANRPALHSACLGASELAHHPGRPGAGPAHPITELRTRPCSTRSASDCARRSTA